MALIDDSDLRKPEAEPKVVFQQAPRGPLVPILLVVLILCVIALAVIVALPYIRTDGESTPATTPQVSASDLDPKLLLTPTGRKLDVVEFGGYLFEITRIAYSNHAPSRTVTITVPGDPPAMGMFHIGESFAGGKIRIAEITNSAVVLECNGQQKFFPIIGSDPSAIWDKDTGVPSGTHLIPPRETGAVPDIPTGAQRPPKHPVPEVIDNPDDRPGIESIDDLPWFEEQALAREDYAKLVSNLPDLLEREFVFAVAIEPETRMSYGLEIKNVLADSYFYSHGLQVGDVILFLNGEPVTRVSDLDSVSRRNSLFADQIMIEIERTRRTTDPETGETRNVSDRITFVFAPGVPD
ncbi:MAG: PDZ domain-containing protein [Planctomycetes bacterium]|nr:PDZ domain-containing protein [Planctomycetota bacterium]